MVQHRSQSGVCELPSADGSGGPVDGELRRHRPVAHAHANRGAPVDASGGLPGGSTFDGVSRAAAGAAAPAGAVRGHAHREALTYGLGRGIEYHDAPGGPRDRPQRAGGDDYRFSSLVLGIVRERPIPDEDVAMIHHQGSTAPADVPARHGRGARAAAARRHGAGGVDAGADAARPVRRLGFVYIPMGMNAAAWTPPTQGRHHRAVAVAAGADAVARSHHRRHQPRAAQRLHDRQPRLVQLRVPELLARQADRGQRLRAGHHRRSDRGQGDRRATRRFRRSSSAPISSRRSATATTATPAPIRTTCRGRRRRRRCRPRPIRAWSSNGCSATAARPERRRAELKRSGSILDWMTADMARLRRELGAGDRTKVGQYLDSVREVERRIQRAEQQRRDRRCRSSIGRPACRRSGKTTSS